MTNMQPFTTEIDFTSGVFTPSRNLITRKLSDMATMYADVEAAQAILESGDDPILYEVQVVDLPEEEGQILHCTTKIYPGKIGDEYYMTKGHYHSRREQGEVYLGLSGTGYLVMQTESGEISTVPMNPGTAAYVPPYWAHRTVNIGTEPFVFFAAWAGEAGHDYGTIERDGFRKLLIEKDGDLKIIDNPKYS